METARSRIHRILRWSERYTKTDMVYLARGGTLSAIQYGAGVAASLALAIAISRFVPQESYGIYKYVLSVVTLLSLFSLNQIGSAVFQSAAQGLDGALVRGFWENIRWSFAVFFGTVGAAIYYFGMGNATLAIGILIGGSLSPFLASANLFTSFLGGKKDFYRQTIYGIADNLIPIVIFIGIIILTSNPLALIATYFFTNTLAALYFWRRTRIVYHARIHIEDTDLLRYSKHLSVMGIINGIANNLDQILIFHFLGAAQVAIYSFATAIPDQIKDPMKSIGVMLQPRFVERNGVQIKRSMGNKILWYGATSLALTVIYIAAAPFIFHLLFSRYVSSIWYSQLYALWLLTIALDPVATYLVARKLTKELYVNSSVYSVVQIAGVSIGVIWWGITGVIAARILTRVSVALANYALYRRAIDREIAAARAP